MQTALGTLILFVGYLFILLGFYGLRVILRKGKTIHKGKMPTMPKIYGGTMLDHLRNDPKMFHYSLN